MVKRAEGNGRWAGAATVKPWVQAVLRAAPAGLRPLRGRKAPVPTGWRAPNRAR